MGDANTVLSPEEARHLLRRIGFGTPKRDLDRILDAGETRGQAADRLLAYKAQSFKPNGRDFETAHSKWIKFLLKARSPVQAKLALFWHDHFATGYSKVQNTDLMADQIHLLHASGAGNFKQLVKDINRNAAMMEFLDTVRNQKDIPNENYARELQELFTLGVNDSAGNPNYLQEDIVQIARAFTGWDYGRHESFLRDDDHDFMADFPERGPKVIYKSTGGFGAGGRSYTVNGEGESEIDTVVDIIFEHTDSNGKNTVARRTTRRLLEFFAHPDPSLALIDALVTESNFAVDWELKPLLRAMFTNDAFYLSMAPAPFAGATKKSVKWPIDYVIGTMRMLDMKFKSRSLYVDGGSFRSALEHLSNMGQIILDPPSVFGWDWETSWISSSTLLARYSFARDLTSARGHGSSSFRPNRLMSLELSDPGDIVDAVTGVLGVTDQFTPAERNVFIDYLTDGGVHASLDLNDNDTRNTKLHGLFALVMQSPAYQLH